MDRYKNFVRIEELKGLLKAEKNEEALELAQGIDVKKVKDNWDLMVIAEVYLKNGMLGRAKECYTIVYNKKKSRRVAMELVNICIRLKKADEAEGYFEDYRRMAPNDYYNYIFRFKIDRLKGKPLKEQAADLEALKKVEFCDNWGYELAKLYHKMGEKEKCLKICEDVIIWFGDGEFVDKAKTLRALYLGEISLKDISNPNALNDKPDLSKYTEEETKEKISKVSSNLDIDVVIDYQMEFDHAVDEIMNHEKEGAESTEKLSPKEDVVGDESPVEKAHRDEYPVKETLEYVSPEEGTFENESPVKETLKDISPEEGTFENESPVKETLKDISPEEETFENGFPVKEPLEDVSHVEEQHIDGEGIKEDIVEEDLAEAGIEEEYREEEYTEEDLSLVNETKEDEKVVVRHTVHDNDFFTDEIAKAVEQALKEDSDEKKLKSENADPQDMTREWRKPDRKECEKNKEVNESKAETFDEYEHTLDHKISDDQSETDGSPLLEAVERELGFVGVQEEKPVKKSWFERRKEKHREKELRKKEAEKKAIEAEDREQLEKERAAEREKQKFIENEKKRDRQKYQAYRKQMASIANEKAKEQITRASEEFIVDINGIQEERETGETKEGIYIPKKMKCIEIPVNSIINGFLTGRGRTLEDYFGFFACQRNMSSQILNCIERLLDPEEEVMNYCIIGERGSGKKAIAHGLARFMADCGKLAAPQTVWTDSNKINAIDLSEKTDKLRGRCLVIDQAGALDREGIEDISKVIEKLHKKTMLVLTDYPRNMVELFKAKEGFEDMFAPRIIIPSFSQEDLFDYVDYKVGAAGFVFDSAAYDLMSKRIKSIMRATEEGALARTEKYLVKTIDNAEQRNGEAYIRQTLVNEKHTRSNVITVECLPESL